MHSEIEPKYIANADQEKDDLAISKRLQVTLVDHSLNSIGTQTGYHPETIRRYMSGTTKIPAAFIGKIAAAYFADAHSLLLGHRFDQAPIRQQSIQELPTDSLINELGRRMKMIEDCAVGSAALKHSMVQ